MSELIGLSEAFFEGEVEGEATTEDSGAMPEVENIPDDVSPEEPEA